MVEYECYKCKRSFDRKSTYEYHVNKKFSCIIEERPIKKNKMIELEEELARQKEEIRQIRELLQKM